MDVRPQVQDVDKDGDSNVDGVEDNEDVVIYSLEDEEDGTEPVPGDIPNMAEAPRDQRIPSYLKTNKEI